MRISTTRMRRLANAYWPQATVAVGLVCFLFFATTGNVPGVPRMRMRALPRVAHVNTFDVKDPILGFPRPVKPFGNCFGCVQKRPLKIRHRSYNPDKHIVYYGVSCPAPSPSAQRRRGLVVWWPMWGCGRVDYSSRSKRCRLQPRLRRAFQ